MLKSRLARNACALVLAACGLAQALETGKDATGKPIRIAACDEHVQSHKRGVCANALDDGDFKALAPGVSWWYNWHFKPSSTPPAGVNIEFLPMGWTDSPDRLQGLEDYLAAGNKPRAVLAINEPNLKGQAFITPEHTAELYKKIKAIADKYNLPTVGPQMALGSPAGDSITADDPITNKKTTYTFMVPFLEATQFYLKPDKLNQVGWHSYGNIYELRHFVDTMGKQFGPTWVTEYAQWKTKNDAEALKYLVQSTDYLERSPDVAGYAWFKERVKGNPRISLLGKGSGELTQFGQAYVDLPVHYADVYYQLPGKLSAARYVTLKDVEISPADEKGAFVQMASEKNGGTLSYNVVVPKEGKYAVAIRTHAKPGDTFELQSTDAAGKADSTAADWETLTIKILLHPGPQTLTLGMSGKGQAVESLEFSAP